MGINKVQYGNQTLIDLTGDDVARANVLDGKYFHLRDGTRTTGQMANNGAISGSISTKAGTVTVPAGYTSGGSIGISATEQAKIIAGNIKSGVTLLGQAGSLLDPDTFDIHCQETVAHVLKPASDTTDLLIPATDIGGRQIQFMYVSGSPSHSTSSTATQTRYAQDMLFTRNAIINGNRRFWGHSQRLARTSSTASVTISLFSATVFDYYYSFINESQLSTGGMVLRIINTNSIVGYWKANTEYYMLIGG